MSFFAPSAALLHSVPPPLRLAALSAHPAYAPGAALSPYGASLTLPAPGFLLTVPEPAPVAPLVLPEPSAASSESAAPSARAGGGKYVGGFKGLPNFAASQPPSGGGAAGKFGRGRGPSGGEAGALAASPAGGGSASSLARGGGGGAAAAANALPEGWTTQRDDEGDTYYFNTVTGESRWERPLPPKGAARTWGGGAGASTLSSSGQVFQGIKAAGPAVKSTLVTSPVSAPKVEIEAVTVDGDTGCDAFEANPFKPEMCKRCRKLRTKH